MDAWAKILGAAPRLLGVVKSIGEGVKAAKAAESAGGRKVTRDEVGEIVVDHLEAIASIFVDMFAREVK